MVSRLIRNFTRSGAEPYRLRRLIDSRLLEEVVGTRSHVICDIDKTYLETEFESLVRMARIAFESASDKITVSGASEVLRALRWGDDTADPIPGEPWPRPLHFVSSSPPQLRPVLEEKLMIDDLDWTSDTFKDQAYNLLMGRMDLLRHHVAYKSLAILGIVAQAGPGASFTMIGDNAESDAFIYLGIKLIAERLLTPKAYAQYLEIAGVEKDVSAEVVAVVKNLPKSTVRGILIRDVPGYSLVRESPLTDSVRSFDNFFQAALLLMGDGMIAPSLLWPLVRSFHNLHGIGLPQIAGMLASVIGAKGAPESLKAAAAQGLPRLQTTADLDAGKLVALGLASSDEGLRQMSESQILRSARSWMENMHLARARRKAQSIEA